MDAPEQIKKFTDFINQNYLDILLENVRKKSNYLEIDYQKLAQFDPILADILLEQPLEVIKAAEIAIEQIDFDHEVTHFQVLFKNLPQSSNIPLSEISDQLEKFLTFEGYIMKPSDIFLKATSARFECPACGTIIRVLMDGRSWKSPTRCGCGRKGKFNELGKDLVKFRRVEIQEPMDDIPDTARKPTRKKVYFANNLIRKELNNQFQPGQRVRIHGFLELENIHLQGTKQSNEFRTNIIANNIIPVQNSWGSIKLTPLIKKHVREMAKNDKLLSEFAQSLAPSFEGYELVRKSLILHHIGSKRIFDKNDNLEERATIHILMTGNPGTGKSILQKKTLKIAPLWHWTQGAGLTKAGFVAAVIRDEYGSYTLEVGPFVMAHKGSCGLDEMEKMNKGDYGMLNNGMNDEKTKITKANIDQWLKTETSLISTSNPLHKKFVDSEPIMSQLKPIPKDLLDRFDVIWAMREKIDQDKFEEKYMSRHTDGQSIEQIWTNKQMQNYIVYARQLNPMLPKDISKYFSEKFKKFMGNTSDNEQSHRLRGNIFRWIYAHCRFISVGQEDKKNDIEVTKKSVDFGFILMKASFKMLDLIDEKGFNKYEDLEQIPSKKEVSKYYSLKELIKTLSETYNNSIPIERIIEEAMIKCQMSETEVEISVEKLKRAGDLFEPRRGYIAVI